MFPVSGFAFACMWVAETQTLPLWVNVGHIPQNMPLWVNVRHIPQSNPLPVTVPEIPENVTWLTRPKLDPVLLCPSLSWVVALAMLGGRGRIWDKILGNGSKPTTPRGSAAPSTRVSTITCTAMIH
jgi:hypothetical protein